MSITTTALVVRDTETAPKLEQVTLGALQPDEALVEIAAVGVCHTDLSCANGTLPATFPNVFGHEGAGVILTPPQTRADLAAGDKVLLSFAHCQQCEPCTSSLPSYCYDFTARNFSGKRLDGTSALSVEDGSVCSSNFFGQSSFMRKAVVHKSSIVKVPSDTPLEQFAALGCGLMTGAGCVLYTLDVKEGKSMAVFGCGSVGMAAIMAAKIRKAHPIIAVDLLPSRRALAKELGATHAIDGAAKDLVQQIQAICPPNGLNFAADATGVPAVISMMVDSLGTKGKAAQIGAPTPGTRVGIDIFSQLLLGRQYVGCTEGDATPSEALPYLIEEYHRGNFPVDKLLTFYAIEDFEKAFKDTKDGTTVKAILRWS